MQHNDVPAGTARPAPTEPSDEPLPIWFFVGLILAVYGAILIAAAFFCDVPDRVVPVTNTPAGLWWGALLAAFGLVQVALGLRGRRR